MTHNTETRARALEDEALKTRADYIKNHPDAPLIDPLHASRRTRLYTVQLAQENSGSRSR